MTTTERDQIEQAAQQFATQVNLPYFDTRSSVDITPLIHLLTITGMQAYGIVPLALDGAKLTLGTSEVTNQAELPALTARLTGYEPQYVFISQTGWSQIFNRILISPNQDIINSGDFSPLAQRLNNIEPRYILEPIAQLAYQFGASDIHVEPTPDGARVRFRLDGTLHPILNLPRDRYELFASDLQMRAGVKWGGDKPQGGRFSTIVINSEGEEVPLNMRLESIPSLSGQDIVLRLFNISTQYLNIDKLQLTPSQRDILLRAVRHPRGLILTVGPTGSGKTSTLYSIINHLNNPEIKIVTLEDPVEYELDGISQIPVRSDDQESFTEKLRAVLREDPNVIMIGEIRDADTAKTALQAALTGHLVLSTFHAATSSAAVTRLMDMIGQNPLLASSLRLVMAQRLVRALCTVCRSPYTATKSETLEIKTALQHVSTKEQPDYAKLRLYKAVGCDVCRHYGYRGRLSVIEQLEFTPTMQTLVGQGTSAITTQAIEQAAIKDGMVTLMEDGVRKALAGLTTLEEIYTALGE